LKRANLRRKWSTIPKQQYFTIEPPRLLDAEAKFPREGAIPYNLACYYCQLGEMETAKDYLKKAFEIDLNWRTAALNDDDLKPLWDSLQTPVE
jgi:hypothetical protein